MESRILTKRAIEALNTAQEAVKEAERAVMEAEPTRREAMKRLIWIEWFIVDGRRLVRRMEK